MCAQCITSGQAMPHNLRKCSALRIRAVVNKFIQEHMNFRYSGDWTVPHSEQEMLGVGLEQARGRVLFSMVNTLCSMWIIDLSFTTSQ